MGRMLSPISLRAEASFSSSSLARCAAGEGCLFEGRNIEQEVVPLDAMAAQVAEFQGGPGAFLSPASS
jgi:hypothetical protein